MGLETHEPHSASLNAHGGDSPNFGGDGGESDQKRCEQLSAWRRLLSSGRRLSRRVSSAHRHSDTERKHLLEETEETISLLELK